MFSLVESKIQNHGERRTWQIISRIGKIYHVPPGGFCRFFFSQGRGSSKGHMFIDKEINPRGSRMYKDPFPRDVNG